MTKRGDQNSKDNDARYYAKHKEKRRLSQKQRATRNATRIQHHKLDTGCQVCGLLGPSYVLDLHHLDPDSKSFRLGNASSRSVATVEAELVKCVVLCANCHRMVENGDLECP